MSLVKSLGNGLKVCFNIMKKLILLLLFVPLLSFGQGNFKITSNNELVWEKILDYLIDIEPQTITLQQTTKKVIYLRDIHSAELTIQVKGNRTRLYVKNIKNKTPLDDEPKNIDDVSKTNYELFSSFINACIQNGIYFAPSKYEAGFISATHGDMEIDKTLEVINKIVKTGEINK